MHWSGTSPAEQEEIALMQTAVRVLGENTGFQGQLRQPDPALRAGHDADGILDLIHDGRTTSYLVECKTSVDRKIRIDQIQRRLSDVLRERQLPDLQGMLVVPSITSELAKHCREIGLQFIDTCGNAYLRSSGFFVFITGERKESGQLAVKGPKGLTNTAALRVVFVLLSQPGLVNAPFKDIARCAGVALGTVYNVLEDLDTRGFLLHRSSTLRRKLIEPRRLVDEWAINYPTTLRTKLHERRFSAPDRDWWKTFGPDAGFPFSWGAEVAAEKMTAYLRPATQTLYIPSDEMDGAVKALVKRYRLRPDASGEVVLLEKFWHCNDAVVSTVVPPLLVYSELLATLDPRTQETAQVIREKFIDASFDSP